MKDACARGCLYINTMQETACEHQGRDRLTGRDSLRPQKNPSNSSVPKQASATSWIACVRVRPVWPDQRAVRAEHCDGSKHGADAAREPLHLSLSG